MKPHTCFAMPGVVPMLRGDASVYGGSELRAWRFARGLADLGFPVSLIGPQGAHVPSDRLGPVRLVTDDGESTRNRPFGWLWRSRRGSGPSAPWQKAAADIYVSFAASEYTAQLADWGRTNRRPVVLMAGSDADFATEYVPGNTARTPYGNRCDLCYKSIIASSAIVVQTETQRKLALQRFGREATVIANPVTMPPREPSSWSRRRYFLWIGKSDRVKRPELFAELARMYPDLSFRAIINPMDRGLLDSLRSEASPNLEIVERVEPERMSEEFAAAIALVNTSRFEGLPNAMLEAGAHGVPVLSLSVDPDGILSSGGGFAADGSLNELAAAIRRFAGEPDLALSSGARLRRHVSLHHDASARIAELGGLLQRLMAPSGEMLARETA